MNAPVQRIGALAACFLAGIIAVCWRTEPSAAGSRHPKAIAAYLDRPETKIASSWDQKAAAAYLDRRAGWWMEWPKAARDHETFCVSCHTAVPYALSRPALCKALAEEAPSAIERRLLANVTKRVRLWKEVAPFYSDADRGVHKTVESRGTESVLNALILSSNDAQNGQLSHDTRTALDNMWAEQQTTINRVVLLWASAKVPGLLDPERQKAIINEVLGKQQADGGWSLSSLVGGWKREDGTPQEVKSDGYATGLITFALQQAGIPRENAQQKQGLVWLEGNQNKTGGFWLGYSLNKDKEHHLTPSTALFMNDAATAYAVLALTEANRY